MVEDLEIKFYLQKTVLKLYRWSNTCFTLSMATGHNRSRGTFSRKNQDMLISFEPSRPTSYNACYINNPKGGKFSVALIMLVDS